MSDKDSETEKTQDSENKTNTEEFDVYEDACENHDDGEQDGAAEEEVRDSLGHSSDSPDFVDEDKLRSWETGDHPLSESDLEQKRLEAAQYKLEGNSLYTEGKTLEAVGN